MAWPVGTLLGVNTAVCTVGWNESIMNESAISYHQFGPATRVAAQEQFWISELESPRGRCVRLTARVGVWPGLSAVSAKETLRTTVGQLKSGLKFHP